jgi:hypothetical protein
MTPLSVKPAKAQNAPYFNLFQTAKGIEVYTSRKGDLMVFVDLSQGARIDAMTGSVTGNFGKGMFGGPNKTFSRLPIQQYWKQCIGCLFVFNGSVFAARTSEGPGGSKALHYALRMDNQLITEGKGEGVPFSLLQVWEDHADIMYVDPSDPASLAKARDVAYGVSSTIKVNPLVAAILRANNKPVPESEPAAPFALGGVMQRAKKDPVSRTFLFVLDRNKDGKFETIVLCRTVEGVAEDVYVQRVTPFLQSLGNYRLLVLDGGPLSQVMSKWSQLNALTNCEALRPVPDYSCHFPQALAVYAAP